MKMWWLTGFIVLSLMLASIWDYYARMKSTYDPENGPRYGVVFTGQFIRVREGLDLLKTDRLDNLLISGVNSRAGMTIDGFADQFDLDGALRKDLASGRLFLSARADDTFENATETRCWLENLSSDSPVVLITSVDHMPRASVALELALGGRNVERLSISDDRSGYRGTLDEFGKYLATYAISLWQHMSGYRKKDCYE